MKRLRATLVLALAFGGFVGFISNTDSARLFAQKDGARAPDSITPEMVKPHVIKLAGDDFEGRGAGYPGELKAARYIADEFKRIGLKPAGDSVRGRRTYFQEFKFHPYHPVVAWQLLNSRNVLGLIEGTDPVLKKEIVVIGAHYDGQGRAGQADPTRRPANATDDQKDEIWNSANDNATSVAAILEIARAVKRAKSEPKRSILFAAFGAEEHGMTGSIYYVNHPAFPLGDHVAMINLEKLGRSPEKPLSVNGGASSPAWAEILKAAESRSKARVSVGSPFTFPDSDHYPFGESRIPALLLYVSTGVDTHQPSDTADKIDYARVAEAARYAMAVVLELADQAKRPAYAPSPIPRLGMIGHLATGAEADAVGLGASESGLKVTGVIAGSPAADAGLREGDLIVEFAGNKFHRTDTLAALMAKQRELLEGKFGFRLPLTVLRDKKRSEMTLNLGR